MNTANNLRLFCSSILLLLLVNCNRNDNDVFSTDLYVDKNNTTIKDTSLVLNKINITYFGKDSIIINRYYSSGFKLTKSYFKENNAAYYEYKNYYNFDGSLLSIDSILFLSKIDTSFSIIHKDFQKYPAFLTLGMEDYNYKIFKRKNAQDFVSEKESLINPQFKELYYFDNNFIITQIIIADEHNKYVFTNCK